MGNRAVITTAPFNEDNVGVYLHWNGGIESVEAFCKAAKELGYRDPLEDPTYGFARLTGLISLFFDITGNTSLGVGRCADMDCCGDNGVWLLGPGWTIVGNTYDDPGMLENSDPEKTATIYRQLVVGARTCATAFQNTGKVTA